MKGGQRWGGVGFVYAEQFAELDDEALCHSQFAGGNAMPALDEYFVGSSLSDKLIH